MVPKTLLPPYCPIPELNFIIFMLLTGLQAPGWAICVLIPAPKDPVPAWVSSCP